MGRALLVVDEGVDQGVVATVATGREVLSKGNLRTFTGEKSQDVLYLCANPQLFSDDAMLFDDLLDKVITPSGSLSIRALQAGGEQVLARALRLNGFVEVEVKADGLVAGKKDSVEVGFVKTLNVDGVGSSDGAWKISMEDEYIDDSELLDEEDLVRPDPASLKVCGTTGKRKACKDCSCGLAEELAIGGVGDAAPKSNCGSCYLGDAFRCGSCPYLGTPPFKPGEKVTLSAEPDL